MLKVLVIDDERPTLAMFRLFLSAYGYQVETAENGEQGLEVFKKLRPDIVFTDIKMPGMDGIEVLREIKSSPVQSQVIVITGHGDLDKAVAALDLDAADFINKPVERKALDAALLRAEKRMKLGTERSFSLEHTIDGTALSVRIRGSIGANSLTGFEGLLQQIDATATNHIDLFFDDDFSITRDGISSLMAFLNSAKGMGLSLTLKGLSYNFRHIFHMVGIHRSADLDEGID